MAGRRGEGGGSNKMLQLSKSSERNTCVYAHVYLLNCFFVNICKNLFAQFVTRMTRLCGRRSAMIIAELAVIMILCKNSVKTNLK